MSPRIRLGLLLALAWLGCSSSTPASWTVARADGIEVSSAELTFALAADATRPTRAREEGSIRAILVDEALAREARAEVPGAAVRADRAARDAAIALLLDRDLAVGEDELRRFYQERLEEFRSPRAVKLAAIDFRSCAEAQAALDKLRKGTIDFAAAALYYSTDRDAAARGGELGWVAEDRLSAAEWQAVGQLSPEGELTAPIPLGATCRVLALHARRPAGTTPFAEVRTAIAGRVRAGRRARARRELLERLGAPARVTVDGAAVTAALSGKDRDDARTAVSAGAARLSEADLRALAPAGGAVAGGWSAFAQRLGEDLLLWQEAQRAGLERAPTVLQAARASLVGELLDSLREAAAPAALPAARVREEYEKNLGDYTEPRRVRVSALITRDPAKAKRWAEALRRAEYPASQFDKLLPESEDLASQRAHGDLGWIDGRSLQYPDTFKQAALLLAHAGSVSGVVPVVGVHHVLLCTDLIPERVRRFEEVEAQIRAALAARLQRERTESKLESARARVKPEIDWSAVDKIDWKQAANERS
ncbi:MAG TPA: peptidyl-prolyl cis-trans isomerase [Polyangia bacterium]|nr:peptidyl-prolyl cis-trans isomerase [Polyangia bacterium]